MSMISMEKVVKKFGRVTALNGLNLVVNPGEIHGFIGPNGAGKTTAIRVIMGLIKADEGTTTVFGKNAWTDAVEIHKRIAYVPGDVNLWPNLTGGEVIDLFIRLRSGNGEKYTDKLLKDFDLDPSKKCRTYSKGNRQKVALIAAFASDADLYVLDEPTSGLDPLMESVFQSYVKEATDAGKSVLLSSHILSEVEKLCNKVSIIRKGEIIETGTLSELRHLTRTNIHVVTKKPIDELSQIEHLYNYRTEGEGVSFSVDGENIGNIISKLSAYDIVNLESMPPTLEQLFMSHYSGGDSNAK
ncbi:ABC transporter ATP-binding protein [Microaceticoccus formicicus]|uniref:ABC transporter ATP-binding protein n=1 Tax=Microaceticoccus formicicus TaxID=3118105 RepID=UPI003CD01D21|nr:ABC transporter ATP-binding protein [Peptoniphilaceae bacterium AMB_02]